jgi:hypothetical protein
VNNADCYTFYLNGIKLGLTESEANELRQHYYIDTPMRHMGKPIPIPKWRAVRRAFEKDLRYLLPLTKFCFPLPVQLYGPANKHHVHPAVGYYFSFDHILAQIMIDFNPGEIQFEPCEKNVKARLEGKTVVYTNYISAELHLRYTNKIRECHGPDAVVLALAIYHDEATVDSGMKQTAYPLYLTVLNGTGRYRVLGYIPQVFGVTDKQLASQVLDKKLSKASKKKIICHTYRQMTREFIYETLKPMLKYEDSGLVLSIGNPSLGYIHRVFLFLCSMICDKPAEGLIAGPTYSSGFSKCCLCTCVSCSDFTVRGSPATPDCSCDAHWCCNRHMKKMPARRNDCNYDKRATNLASILVYECSRKVHPERYANQARAQTFISAVTAFKKAMKKEGVSPGSNNVMKLFKWARTNRVNFSFFKCLKPDSLHVWMKGMVERTLCRVMQVTAACGEIDKIKYGRNLAAIDVQLQEFIPKQTQHLSRHVRFTQGITKCIKSLSKGILDTLGLDAWKLINLLTQVYFIIGIDGVILPNTTQWYTTNVLHNPKFASSRIANEIPINVTQCVLASVGSVLEAHFAITASSIASTQLRTLRLLLLNCRIQFEKLNNVLRRLVGRFPCVTDTVKSHQILHYSSQFVEVGINPAAWDSSQGEKQHGFMKILWRRISKRGGVSLIELLWKHVTYDLAIRLYDKRVLRRGAYLSEPDAEQYDDSDEETDEVSLETHYQVHAVLGCQDIQCVNKFFRICACAVSCTTLTTCNKSLHKLCIHPFICGKTSGGNSVSVLYSLLEYHMNNCQDDVKTAFLIQFCLRGDHRISVKLLKGIKVISLDNKRTGMHNYHIRATTQLAFGLLSQTGKTMPAFSIVKAMIKNVDGTSDEWFVKVMAICQLKDLTNTAN